MANDIPMCLVNVIMSPHLFFCIYSSNHPIFHIVHHMSRRSIAHSASAYCLHLPTLNKVLLTYLLTYYLLTYYDAWWKRLLWWCVFAHVGLYPHPFPHIAPLGQNIPYGLTVYRGPLLHRLPNSHKKRKTRQYRSERKSWIGYAVA